MSTTLTPPQPGPPSAQAPNLAADGSVKKPWYKQDFYVGRAVKVEELMTFSRQLSSFLRAGVPILDSLGVVAEEGASKKMQEVITDIQRRLRAGGQDAEHERATRYPQESKILPPIHGSTECYMCASVDV